LLRHKSFTVIPGRGGSASPEIQIQDFCMKRSPLDDELAHRLPPVDINPGLIRVPRMPRNDDSVNF